MKMPRWSRKGDVHNNRYDTRLSTFVFLSEVLFNCLKLELAKGRLVGPTMAPAHSCSTL
jgi:hypothetical protein